MSMLIRKLKNDEQHYVASWLQTMLAALHGVLQDYLANKVDSSIYNLIDWEHPELKLCDHSAFCSGRISAVENLSQISVLTDTDIGYPFASGYVRLFYTASDPSKVLAAFEASPLLGIDGVLDSRLAPFKKTNDEHTWCSAYLTESAINRAVDRYADIMLDSDFVPVIFIDFCFSCRLGSAKP